MSNLIKLLLRLLAISSLTICFEESATFIINVYDSIITEIANIFFIGSYYLMIYLKGSGLVVFPPNIFLNKGMIFFKALLVLLLIVPLCLDSNLNLVDFLHESTSWWIEFCLGLFRVFGIEFFVYSLFQINGVN